MVCYSKQKSFTKHVVEAWFKHLFVTASGEEINTVFLIRERKTPFVFKTGIVSQAEAKTILKELVTYFKQGHKEALPFLPSWSCKSYLDEKKFEKTLESELKYNEYAMLLDEEGYFEPSQLNKTLFNKLVKLCFYKYVYENRHWNEQLKNNLFAVSYTHLTLPTVCSM